jgi:hypothetical protein
MAISRWVYLKTSDINGDEIRKYYIVNIVYSLSKPNRQIANAGAYGKNCKINIGLDIFV